MNYIDITSTRVSAVILEEEATNKELRVSDATKTFISWDSLSKSNPDGGPIIEWLEELCPCPGPCPCPFPCR